MAKHASVLATGRSRDGYLGSLINRRGRLAAESLRYFEASADLLWAVDLAGRFTHVNQTWERTLGHSLSELRSRRLFDFVHPDDAQETIAEVLALADGGCDSAGFRNRCRRADGEYVWLEWAAHACLADGVIQGSARSMTGQPKAERLAYEVKRLEGRVAQSARDLEEARSETLQLLAVAGEYRDERTARHSERVGAMAGQIAECMGLSEESAGMIRRAAPLHDIGKLAIPDCVLYRPGKLNGEERSIMEEHAELGARLLFGSRSPLLQLAGVIAESHHERWDGNGFPKGLLGADIPLAGRVVAVADAFDIATHERPHRPACSVAQARASIGGAAGSRFDPGVVEAFLAVG